MAVKKTSKHKKYRFNKRLAWASGVLILVGASIALFLVLVKEQRTAPTITPASNSRHPKTSSTATPAPAKNSPVLGASVSSDWHLTVYYTAVESYHHGDAQTITGCKTRDCTNGNDNLGVFPSDFTDKVKNEGSGRITSAPNAGKYLNWSYDTGYWIDTIPADSHGKTLQPYISAAADDNVLAQGTNFKVADCGSDTSQIEPDICQHLKQGSWTIVDHFTPGLGGAKHIDLYIGEEDQDNFESSNKFVDLSKATIQIGG